MEVRLEFFFPKSGRKYSHAKSYNFSKALISQDDYLIAGAWAACGISEWEWGWRRGRDGRGEEWGKNCLFPSNV